MSAAMNFYQFQDFVKKHFKGPECLFTYSGEWCLPYLGRRIKHDAHHTVQYVGSGTYRKDFPWEGVSAYKQLNAFDSESNEHYLAFKGCPMAGEASRTADNGDRIVSVVAHHVHTWETTSNWQDHHEAHSRSVREPTEEEIVQYCRLLDECTISDNEVRILKTLREAAFIRGSELNHDGLESRFRFFCDKSWLPVSMISRVMDWGRISLAAFLSRDFRLGHRISTEEQEDAGLQDLIDVISLEDFYKDIGGFESYKDAYLASTLRANKDWGQWDDGRRLQWMANEYIGLECRQRRGQLLLSGISRELKFDTRDEKHAAGGNRFSSLSWKRTEGVLFCVFDRAGYCIGAVGNNGELYDSFCDKVIAVKVSATENVDSYYIDKAGNVYRDGVYIAFVLRKWIEPISQSPRLVNFPEYKAGRLKEELSGIAMMNFSEYETLWTSDITI